MSSTPLSFISDTLPPARGVRPVQGDTPCPVDSPPTRRLPAYFGTDGGLSLHAFRNIELLYGGTRPVAPANGDDRPRVPHEDPTRQ